MDTLLWIGGVLLFLLVLMISVGLHEGGHMVVAKKLGVKVPEFFVGFGQKIWSFKRKGTEYGIRWIPAGGYVRIVDENVEKGKPEREMLSYVKPWKRQLIFAAGPAVNIVLGFVILIATFMIFPYEVPNTTVDKINTCSAEEVACGAREAGIQPGDRVISIDGVPIRKNEDFNEPLRNKATATITVLRDGEKITFEDVTLADNRMGIDLKVDEIHRGFGESLAATGTLLRMTVEGVLAIPEQIPAVVKSIYTGERDADTPGSVVGAGNAYGEIAATNQLDIGEKIRTWMMVAGGVNLSLGFINLLPVPPLDGGKMLIAFMDTVRNWFAKLRRRAYKPTPYGLVKWMTVIPAVFLFGIMGLLVLADIVAPMSLFH